MPDKVKLLTSVEEIDINKDPEKVASSTIGPFNDLSNLENGFQELNELFNSTKNNDLKRLIQLASLSMDKNQVNGPEIGNDWNTFTSEVDGVKKGLGKAVMRGKPGKNQGKTAVLAAKSLLGVGTPIDIPLVHSGFTIRIEAQDPYAKTVLYAKLAKLANEAGMATASVIFGSDHAVYSQVIMDYVMDNLISTTLRIPPGKELQDYILIEDDFAICLGVMASLFENGFDVVLGCTNTTIVDDTTVKCNNVIKGKMNPLAALHTDTKRLTDYQNEQMQIRKPNSIYIEKSMTPKDAEGTIYALDVYRGEESTMMYDREVRFENTVHGKTSEITIEFITPSYSRYFDSSTRYLAELEGLIESVISSTDDEEMRTELLRDGMSLLLLNDSSHFVKSIKIDDSKYYDASDIYDILRSIVSNQELTGKILESMEKFRKESTISVAGIPLYQCKQCHQQVGEAESALSKSISPINPYHFFTRLREASM